MPKKIFLRSGILLAAVLLMAANLEFLPSASASSLSKSSVMLTDMNAGAASAIIFEFTTSSSNTGTGLTLQFPQYTGTSNGSVNATQTYSQTYGAGSVNCKTITGASANLPTASSITASGSSTTITFSGLSAYSASTSYCGVLTGSAVTNPSSATANDTAILTAGSDAAQTIALDVISNDQVTVSATVPPSFTLALSGNTDNFTSNLSTGSIDSTTGVTATVNTNAVSGWFLWGSDANTGIKSTIQNYTVASTTPGTNATISSGSEGYVTGLPAGGITQGSGSGGTTSATTAYASSGSGNGSGLDVTPRQLATSNGTANGASVTVKEFATIKGTTPAANDYADTITLVGAGSF